MIYTECNRHRHSHTFITSDRKKKLIDCLKDFLALKKDYWTYIIIDYNITTFFLNSCLAE